MARRAGTVEAPQAPQAPRWRRVGSTLLTLAIVAMALYLFPARFGGSTRLVIVSGHSMEPTYDLGDIVIARDGGTPAVGDIVVFAVPEGTGEGMLVIHRVLEIDDDGYYITQGDNRDTPDQWKLTADDIVGEPLLRIPKAGAAIELLQQLWVLTLIAVLLAVLLLWPSSDDDELSDDEPERQRIDDHSEREPMRANVSATADPDITKPNRRSLFEFDWADAGRVEFDAAVMFESDWLDADDADLDAAVMFESDWPDADLADLDAAVMFEAEAWLDEQIVGSSLTSDSLG